MMGTSRKELLKTMDTVTPPKDRYNMALIIHFYLGLTMLLSWYMFITATAFFRYKFTGSPFVDNFENFFSLAYNFTDFLSLLALNRVASMFKKSTRIYTSLFSSLTVYILITCLVKPRLNPSGYFAFIFLCVIQAGMAIALLQNSLFSLAAKFPGPYTSALVTGQGLAGLVVALSQIFSLLIGGSAQSGEAALMTSAIVYFCVAIVVLFFAILAYFVLSHLPIFLFYHKKYGSTFIATGGSGAGLLAPPKTFGNNSWGAQKIVLRKIWIPALSVCLTFGVTLAIFPSVLARIQSTQAESDKRIFNQLFVPFAFVLYNLFEFIGRLTASRVRVLPQKVTLGLALSRLIFFFLFLFSNVVLTDSDGNPITSSFPVLFGNDYVYWAFIVLFGFSGGFTCNMSMITGPTLVEPFEKEKAGGIMILSLCAGLSIGAALSFVLRAILCRCNPFVS